MKTKLTLLLLAVMHGASFSQSPEYNWRYYRPGNTGIQGDLATSLWIDGNGDPYIAANTASWGEGGIAKFDQAENRWINYSNVDYPVLGSFDNGEVQILDILKGPGNRLWMGSFNGALRFDPEAGASSFYRYDAGNSELQGTTYDLDLAPDGTLWFTSGGLVRHDPGSGEWTYWEGSNMRVTVQPKPDGDYLVWSADTYFGYVFTYNSATGQYTNYLPENQGEIAGLPGKDCVDDAGNFWALRMATGGDWETLEYQTPEGEWVHPEHPYSNVSFYIDAFTAFGDGKALLVTANAETWFFDGTEWHNYGTWRPYYATYAVEADADGNVWVCGVEGAAKRDASTGEWQRYRITNTSQIDYFVEDFGLDEEGNVWLAGNAGSGVGGFQKFDNVRWTGFNEYTYGLGYPFPYMADNVQAICRRPSNGDVVFNPTFNGIHAWDGTSFFPLENLLTTSGGFAEDSEGRLWSIEEFGGLRHYNDDTQEWTSLELIGWAGSLRKDAVLPGTVWAATDYMIMRTDGVNTYSKTIEDFPGSATWLTGFAASADGIVWVGTWSQFTSTGSTLIRLNVNTGLYTTWSYDEGWPFPGEHVRPMAITPDGLLWLQYDSEYPSPDAGLCWFDGETVGTFPAPPGGVPQWGGLPNSTIKRLEVRETEEGYELWMSCLGRGMAVLEVVLDPVTGLAEREEMGSQGLLSAYPNPAGERVSLEFDMETAGMAQLSVFDFQGRKVTDIIGASLERGRHTVAWDLTDRQGARVRDGVYVARLTSPDRSATVKVIVR